MSTNKKFLYLVGKFISIIFAFLITKVPDYILENNFFDSGLAGYDLILYAFLCAAWII